MAGITLADAQELLDRYVQAEIAVLGNQSYRIGERLLTRADLVEIRAGRAEWERKVASLQHVAAGGVSGPLGRMRYGVPRG